MADAAREVIGIVDSTKWGKAAFATFCRIDDVSAVVSDDGAPTETVSLLRSRGVGVHIVAAGTDGSASSTTTRAER